MKSHYTSIVQLAKKHSTVLITGFLITIFVIVSIISDSVKETDFAKSYEAIKFFDKHKALATDGLFFMEVAGNPYLNLRAACAIESATHHHPNARVTLYNLSLVAEDATLSTLLQLPNFRLSPLNLTEVFRDTPLQSWYEDGIYKHSLYPVIKLSDAARYALLWGVGGVYLDMDVIVLRPFDGLHNAMGLEHIYGVNNAVLAFDRHSHVMWRTMQEFLKVYSPYKWGSEGPGLLNRVLHMLCANRTSVIPLVHRLSEFVMDPGSCKGVHVLPTHSFYPVPWPLWPQLFSVVADYKHLTKYSYAVHLWNSLSKGRRSTLGSLQMLDVLAKENCPTVYRKISVPMEMGL